MEIAFLCTKNAFLAHSAENATQTMEQQKATLMEKFHALSDNQTAEIVAHTKQIRVLCDKQTAEIEHLHVRFESHMKLQNQTMERELAAARSEAFT